MAEAYFFMQSSSGLRLLQSDGCIDPRSFLPFERLIPLQRVRHMHSDIVSSRLHPPPPLATVRPYFAIIGINRRTLQKSLRCHVILSAFLESLCCHGKESERNRSDFESDVKSPESTYMQLQCPVGTLKQVNDGIPWSRSGFLPASWRGPSFRAPTHVFHVTCRLATRSGHACPQPELCRSHGGPGHPCPAARG